MYTSPANETFVSDAIPLLVQIKGIPVYEPAENIIEQLAVAELGLIEPEKEHACDSQPEELHWPFQGGPPLGASLI